MDNGTDSNNMSQGDTGRHILLLDDEVAVLNALCAVLDSRGYRCTTATCGEKVLELIEVARHANIRYDVFVFDIKIRNGMGGIETLQQIRQAGCEVPALSISGYATEELFGSEEERNLFSGHLQKPFSANQLVREIERLCDGDSTVRSG